MAVFGAPWKTSEDPNILVTPLFPISFARSLFPSSLLRIFCYNGSFFNYIFKILQVELGLRQLLELATLN